MKLVGYHCEDCDKRFEELFDKDEQILETLDKCCECGGKIVKFNFKQNDQVVKYNSKF
jgi:DNA-directed RNA polymerase subunit RPC12/RpoP